MRINPNDIPVRLQAPGATVRQVTDFGQPSGTLAGEHLILAAGTDIAPLLTGLVGDACQSPHWGHVISGTLVVTYSDGTTERCSARDLFYWPTGHSVRVEADAEIVMFSPQTSHGEVLDHMSAKLAAM